MSKKQGQKVKGCKKAGRNRAKCERYRLAGTREKNKERKRLKRLKNFSG